MIGVGVNGVCVNGFGLLLGWCSVFVIGVGGW